jgi:hypothetical protein
MMNLANELTQEAQIRDAEWHLELANEVSIGTPYNDSLSRRQRASRGRGGGRTRNGVTQRGQALPASAVPTTNGVLPIFRVAGQAFAQGE